MCNIPPSLEFPFEYLILLALIKLNTAEAFSHVFGKIQENL